MGGWLSNQGCRLIHVHAEQKSLHPSQGFHALFTSLGPRGLKKSDRSLLLLPLEHLCFLRLPALKHVQLMEYCNLILYWQQAF